MALIIHTADIHLDSPLAGLPAYEGAPQDAVHLATRRALTNIVDLAIDKNADMLIVAGDLYDGDLRDINTALFLCSELARLRRANVEVVIAHGNHDAESVITRRLPLPDGVKTLPTKKPGTEIFADLGIAVHGQGYASREVLTDLAATYPGSIDGLLNIGVLHTALTGRDGHAPYAPSSKASLAARGYDYWALGHVHTAEVIGQDPWIVFPGCPQGRGLRECGPKGVMVVEADGDHVTSVEAHAVDVVRWVDLNVDASGAAERDDALAHVREALMAVLPTADGRILACRVVVEGGCNAHRALGADAARLTDEVRALALDVGAGEIWVAGVRCATRPGVVAGDLNARRDPIARLLVDARAAAADAGQLSERIPAINELAALMPAGTLGDGRTPTDPQWVAARAAGAERLLMGRLVGSEVT
ncbi:MAG TPA: DNA repair exonuclease [Solirubrobacteraceae bacterium]|nr:DNA repair exonuclease [Solirubrobacteraceae bacterium]